MYMKYLLLKEEYNHIENSEKEDKERKKLGNGYDVPEDGKLYEI